MISTDGLFAIFSRGRGCAARGRGLKFCPLSFCDRDANREGSWREGLKWTVVLDIPV